MDRADRLGIDQQYLSDLQKMHPHNQEFEERRFAVWGSVGSELLELDHLPSQRKESWHRSNSLTSPHGVFPLYVSAVLFSLDGGWIGENFMDDNKGSIPWIERGNNSSNSDATLSGEEWNAKGLSKIANNSFCNLKRLTWAPSALFAHFPRYLSCWRDWSLQMPFIYPWMDSMAAENKYSAWRSCEGRTCWF